MKVQMFRASGRPMDLEKAKESEVLFKKTYDELWLNLMEGKTTEEKKENMDEFRAGLEKVEKEINEKYDRFNYEELPANSKQWKALYEKYGNLPILLVVQDNDKNDLALVLQDGEYQ